MLTLTSLAVVPPVDERMSKYVSEEERSRYRAFQPGGPLTRRFFAHHNTVLVIGSSVFVHAGLTPEHVHAGMVNFDRKYPGVQSSCCL